MTVEKIFLKNGRFGPYLQFEKDQIEEEKKKKEKNKKEKRERKLKKCFYS